MLGAFRIRGLTPTPPRPKNYQYKHPVTGELVPDAIVQFPKHYYEFLVRNAPEKRLKYFDEENDEIIVSPL